MDSIRPLQNYDGGIVPQAVLNGTLGTVVYASNYNDLDNKPSINSVELRGNKTAEDLGLATPADITVTSVNTQTGDVSLTGQNIPYDSTYSVTEKINDLASQIVDSGVSSVNGHTGAVILTGSDINYSVGVSLNAKINAVEGEIPVVNYPVTSVNGETGAVVLAGSDIEYSAGVSINTQIENVAGDLADLTAEDIPMSGTDSTPTATAIGDLSQLTTSVTSSLVGAVNEVNAKYKDYIYEGTNVAITTSYSSGAMYYANISLPDLDSDKLISVTLTDYGGLSNVLMFQITSKNSFRIWSKTSQTLTTLKARLFYVKSTS